MISLLQHIFDLIVSRSFIGIQNRTIRKLRGIILQGINIAKASMGEETCKKKLMDSISGNSGYQ